MKKTILICILMTTIISVANISALEVDITIKDSFSKGETIAFDYEIVSSNDLEIKYYPEIYCPKAPIIEREEIEISLEKDIPYSKTYLDIRIDDGIESQSCKAYVTITTPFLIQIEKNFSIITDLDFLFNFRLDKKIFVLDEQINFDYVSNVEPKIFAVLIYPDETRENIQIPSLVKVSQIGTYSLEIIATKEGYKTQIINEQFGVIERPAEIKSSSIFNKENRLDEQSSEKTISSIDIESSEKPSSKIINYVKDQSYIFYIFVGIIVLLIIVVFFFIVRKYRSKLGV